MTRFGYILSLWQHFKSLCQLLEGLFSIWHCLEPTLAFLFAFRKMFFLVNGQILNTKSNQLVTLAGTFFTRLPISINCELQYIQAQATSMVCCFSLPILSSPNLFLNLSQTLSHAFSDFFLCLISTHCLFYLSWVLKVLLVTLSLTVAVSFLTLSLSVSFFFIFVFSTNR